MGNFSLSGGVEVTGFISPTNPLDEYPVIDPLYGIDGFRNVNLLSDLNNIPELRRRAGMVVGVSGGTEYYRLLPSPWNYTISDWVIFNSGNSGGTSTFTGGTVTGDTIFTNGLTATTFSAMTYLGLPIDVYVTGGTYSDGVTTFTNVTGGTFNVVGYYTGNTDNNQYVTGFTYQDNTFTISDNSGSTFNAIINTVTGLTVNGVLSATTYQNLPLDVYVTGLTFNTSNYDLTIGRNDGVSFTDSLSILSSDLTVTGGTYNPNSGVATFTNNTGGTFDVSGFITGFTDIYTTGITYSNNEITISDTANNTYSATINTMTGLTVNGVLSATTIGNSGNCVSDLYVSNIHSCSPLNINPLNEGNVYFGSTSGVTIDLTNNRVGIGTSTPSEKLDVSGKTKTINLQVTSGATTGYVLTSDSSGNATWQQTSTFTGGTVNGLTANTISATTYYNLPIDPDTFTTGYTYNENTFTIKQNNGQPDLTATINSVTGWTVNGDLTVTGNTLMESVTATTISATTYQNLPTDVFVTGGTYTSGTAIFTNNTGGTFNVSGFAIGGGGGQVFYLNLSQPQGGNRFLSTTASTASEQTSGVTIANGVTSTIASFQSQPLNITLLPGGIWSFYLHSYKQNNNASFNIFVEVYKRTSGGTETLLFATDPAPVTTNSPNPSMQLSDGYFSGTPLSLSDSIVATVRATNTGNQSHSVTLFTEGSNHYSYVVSTIPTQQGLTCDTLSGCTTIVNLENNKVNKSGDTMTGTLYVPTISATTISASTISAPGSTTQVIYNNGGVLSADTGFVYTGNKITLGQSGATTASSGEIILNRFTTGTNVGGIRAEQTGNGVEIGGSSYYDKIMTTNGAGIRFWTYVSGVANTERMRITNGTGTTWGVGINTTTPAATLHVAGTNLMSAATQNVLTIVGSGNSTTSPIFTIQGSSGELFSVSDSLTGSLFSVNDISGLPILEVFSDNTTLMGSYLAPSLNTTSRVIATTGTTNVYSIPTSAYTGAFFDYTVSDGTNLRAGNIMSIWSGSSVNMTETQTTDFGNTSGITFNMVVSSGNAILRTSGITGNWTVKTIVRSI